MKKATAILLLVVVNLLLHTAPLWAIGEVGKAKKNLDMGFQENAYEILKEYIKNNPTDLEANLQLGRYYLLTGNDSSAMERFNCILKKNSGYKSRIGNVFQEVVKTESQKNCFDCQRMYRLLVHSYGFNPHTAINAEQQLIRYGDMARSQRQYDCAESFYRLAEQYGPQKIRVTIAHRYLYLAALGYRTDDLKRKVEPIVGKNFIDQVFPGTKTITVFEKTYTYADAFEKEHGQIYTFQFDKDGILPGDKVEVIAKPINGSDFSGDEIWICRGKNFIPSWYQTTNGYFSIYVETSTPGKILCVSLGGRKDLQVKVKVTRKKNMQPNFQLLAMN